MSKFLNASGRLETISELIREMSPQNLLHQTFAGHLSKCAKALRDLEWEFSGECIEGSADDSIRETLGQLEPLEQAINRAVKAREDLIYEIEQLKKYTDKMAIDILESQAKINYTPPNEIKDLTF